MPPIKNNDCIDCKALIWSGCIRCKSCSKKGDKNGLWKGNDVSYGQLHQWVKRNKEKKENCEICGEHKTTELANVSGKYKRNINDYQWTCRFCHMESDGRMNGMRTGHHKCAAKAGYKVRKAER